MRNDIYQRITDQIIGELEKGVRPWMKPWSPERVASRVVRPLRYNGVGYQGINILMLWAEAMAKGYAAPIWVTFKQAMVIGGCVRRGEKGSLVVYANSITRTETDNETDEETATQIHYMKGYTVFNVEQIDGLPTHYYAKPARPTPTIQRDESVERFFAATSADIRHGGDRAYYACHTDHIQMPPLDCFRDAESYYATLAHEETHWTKHPSRLDRDLGRKRWGDEGYAMEELVAELGAPFLCADLELTPELRDDHASYIDHWLKVLKSDKRAIFAAASHAQRAADFLHSLQPQRLRTGSDAAPETQQAA
jgi:antirestriction protein ArdC